MTAINDHDTPGVELSPTARARRDDMLPVLRRAVRARRRRRRAAQGALAAAPLLLVAVANLLTTSARTSTPPVGPAPTIRITQAPELPTPEPALTHVLFSTIRTEAELSATILSDDELIDFLRSAGYEAGVARIGPRVVVTGMPAPADPAPPRGASSPGASATPPASATDLSV